MKSIKQYMKDKLGITSLQKQIKELNIMVSGLQKELQVKEKQIIKLKCKNASLNDKVQSNEDWVRKTREQMWEERTRVTDIDKKVSALVWDVHSQSGKIESVERKVDNNRTDINNSFQTLNENVQKMKRDNMLEHRKFQYEIFQYMDSDKYAIALCDWYYNKMGKMLDLDNPKTFNEIIQWTKVNDMTPDKIMLADKYLVREWIKEKIGEKYLVPLLGVWDRPEEIDYDTLPDKFVLKCNHGCGYNIIVTDKSAIDVNETTQKLNDWLNEDFSFKNGFELQYSRIKRCIIAEEYIENDNQDLYDYKVFCFNGKAKYIMFLSNRKNGLKMQFYDLDWNLQPFTYSYERSDDVVEKPENLSELIDCAEKMATGYMQVRIDFYRLNNGDWKFGEMTFTSASGVAKWEPEEYDRILGDMIELNERV